MKGNQDDSEGRGAGRISLLALLILTVLFAVNVPWARAEDDFGFWQQIDVKTLDTEKIDLSTYGEWRLRQDASDLTYWQASEKLRMDFWKNLGLGLNYTYLNTKSYNTRLGHDEMLYHHRIEFEAIPHWDLGKWAKFEMRDRVELRWIENQGADNTRYRSRWLVDFPLKKNFLPFKSVYLSTEVFYDDSLHEFTEQQTVPLGLNFKINDKTSWKLFLMVQSKEKAGNWNTGEIIGTSLSVRL
jgi:hypothetical protein